MYYVEYLNLILNQTLPHQKKVAEIIATLKIIYEPYIEYFIVSYSR